MIIKKLISGLADDIFTIVLLSEDKRKLTITKYGKTIAPTNVSYEERIAHGEPEVMEYDPLGLPPLMKHPTIEGMELGKQGELVIDFDNIDDSLLDVNNHLKVAFTADSYPIGIYNMYRESVIGKETNSAIRQKLQHNIGATLFKKFKDSDIEEVVINLNIEDDFFTNIPNLSEAVSPLSFNEVGLTLSGVTQVPVDGVVELTAQLSEPKEGIEIYLKTDCGVLSHRKVVTDMNGTAKFRVKAEMLTVGEVFKVKAGFKYYSNAANLELEVI